jgi:hypothetical protein
MAVYKVTSVSSKALVKREEYIDTDACALFRNCKNAKDVEREYNKIWFPQIQPNATDAKAMSHMTMPVGAQDGCWGVRITRYDDLDAILEGVDVYGKE